MTISVIFENREFIIVNKPIGISIHNGDSNSKVSNQYDLLNILGKQLKYKKLYPVHRLDKETSGIQIFALNSESAKKIAEEFQTSSVIKIYLGILRGKLKVQNGVWKKPLTDKSEGRKYPEGIAAQRIPCETHFKLIQQNNYFSLCEFDIKTGRQHQIRKHSAISGHALVGDSRYGDPKYNDKIESLYKTQRMFLHCNKIIIAGQIFESKVPDEFNLLML